MWCDHVPGRWRYTALRRPATQVRRVPRTARGPSPACVPARRVTMPEGMPFIRSDAKRIVMLMNLVPSLHFQLHQHRAFAIHMGILDGIAHVDRVVILLPTDIWDDVAALEAVRAEASPRGSMSTTTSPSEPLPVACWGAASIRAKFGTSVPVAAGCGMAARGSFGISPSVSEMLFSAPSRQIVTSPPQRRAPYRRSAWRSRGHP